MSDLVLSKGHQRTFDPQTLVARGMHRTLERLDSILLGEQVRITSGAQSDAYFMRTSTKNARGGDTVHDIDFRMYPNNYAGSPNFVLTEMGSNYHALAHLLAGSLNNFAHFELDYETVRHTLMGVSKDSPFTDRDTMMLFVRMLDCARVERVTISLFPSTMYYFASLAYQRVKEILAQHTNHPAQVTSLMSAYLFLSARPYIAGRLRREILETLKSQTGDLPWFDADFTQAAMTVVGTSFSGLSRDDREAVMIKSMSAYLDLFTKTPATTRILSYLASQTFSTRMMTLCSPHSSPSSESQMSPEQEEQAQSQAQDVQGDGQDGQDGEGEDGESESSSSASSTAHSLKKDAEQAQNDVAEQARADEGTRDDIESLESESSGAATFSAPIRNPALAKIDSDSLVLSRRLSRQFGKIIEASDPGFIKHESSGRINMSRAMHGIADYDTAFDLWDEGNQMASSMEVALALDVSMSMSRQIDNVSRSAWAICRAVESLGEAARTTVFAFNYTGTLVKPAEERTPADRYYRMNSIGGTVPMEVLVDAERLMKRSKKAHKILIILTDGVWAGDPEVQGDYATLIAKMQREGVHVALAYLRHERDWNTPESYGADTYRDIKSGDDLTMLSSELVRAAMNKRK